jgi:cytochrome c oxidase assembly factor CtaG
MIDWRQWQNEPGLVGAIAVVGWLYALGVGPLRTFWAPASPFPGRAACRFAGGLFLLWFAVASPFEQIGRYYLFSAQMCTQMLIVYPVAWLLLTGLPPGLLDWLLALLPGSRHWGRVLFRPLTCGAAFVLGVSIWYLPRIYEWGLEREVGLAAEHLLFLLAGVLFWWPLASPSRRFPALRFGARMAYLFATEVAMTAVFSYLLMAEHPLYPSYELAPRLIASLDALNDQVFAGILLSGISSLVMVAALGASFYHWWKSADSGAHH